MTAIERSPLLPTGTAVLEPFVAAGLLRESEVQVAGAIARVVPGTADEVLLAAALCVRALQLGHVCVELDRVADTIGGATATEQTDDGTPADAATAIEDLPWPDSATWADVLRLSDAVVVHDPISGHPVGTVDAGVLRPLVFDGHRVYLERYWRYERQVGDALLRGAAGKGASTDAQPAPLGDAAAIGGVLDRLFGTDDDANPDLQRRGAATALRHRLTVLAGGPGTGKTHTVARLLAAIHQLGLDAGLHPEVALAAPTGKAAARMTEAVHQAVDGAQFGPDLEAPLLAAEATTIHRLLGYRDGITFRHDHENPLPHDVVVIDETSMVALPLMARLLDALRPDARLVLVGDPFQLVSVEAGAVLADIVGPAARATGPATGPLAGNIVVLERARRFAADSTIAALADAVKSGDATRALDLLRDPATTDAVWVDPTDDSAMRVLRTVVTTNAADVARAARAGDALLALRLTTEVKVLCGTRFGPLGSYAWRDDLEARLPKLVPGLRIDRNWYVGRPVIITSNDYLTGLFNGDTGIAIADGDRTVVAMPGAEGTVTFTPSQLDAVETWWAMTIHKSQGSEFDHAVVSLPEARSRVLTNELLYTGVTRAKTRLTIVATEESIRTAIENPVARASGLESRLWG